MRILDERNHKEISGVLILLTPKEAHELLGKLRSIDVTSGDHIHVDDETYKREIKVAIYTEDNLEYFNPEIKHIIDPDRFNL